MTNTRSLHTIDDLQPGDHLCCLYETEEEHRAVLTPFVRQGLERGEKVLYIVDARTAETVLSYLRDEGLDAKSYVASGQLVTVTADDAYLKGGVFDPDRMIALLRTETERALAEGYAALRVTGEMTWALREAPGSKRLIEYEAKLNEFFPGSRCLAMCQYDRRAFSPELLLEVLSTHPVAVVGTEVYDNPYYMPPADFLSDVPQAAQLRDWVENLAERKRAQEALRESEQRYRDLYDDAPIAYFSVGTDGRIGRCNRRAGELVARAAEELVGQPVIDLYADTPAGKVKAQKVLRRFRAGEEIRGEELEMRRADATTVWVSLSVRPVRDTNGRVVESRSMVVDITERKRAEEAVRESEEKLRSIIDTAQDAVISMDQAGVITAWNAAAETIFGWSRREALGRTLADTVMPPQLREAHVRGLEHFLATGEGPIVNKRIEITALHRDGHEFPVELAVWVSGSGGAAMFNGFVHDITQRKRAEERIRAQGAFLQAVLDALSHPFYVVDADDYTIRAANAAARAGSLSGTITCYTLTHGSSEPCRGDAHVCPLAVVKKSKAPVTVEHTHHDADGYARAVEVHCHPVFDDEGNVHQVIEYALDITERRRAEEELEKLRSEFLGMVTHELKTPLTAIKGSAAMALGSRRPFSNQENRELYQIIDEQADRLRDLMDNLLDMSRIEAGSLSVSPESTDLRAVLEEAQAAFARSVGSRRVQLKLPDDLPAVDADRHRVGQVLTNLLNNAARFSPAATPITIEVEQDPIQVTVHVKDKGRGIARDKLSQLFKKFSRVHGDTEKTLSGTGLGLAICKGIVEAHGGRIWADSAGEGQGCTFSFTLPVATDTGAASLTDETQRAVHLGKVGRSGERTRVLAVDDEPQVLHYLQRSLDEAGFQPIVTGDPSQVARLVELEEPDLILLDLRLPGMSGFDLLQRIREFSGVPVIFLTASDSEEDAVRALRMGADDYITKPFSPSELLARIGAALRRRLLPDLTEARPPFVLGDLTVNFAERRVTVKGREVRLSATEYKILYELATHAGRVLTYDQILHQVWGSEYSGETELVRSLIRGLRRKLSDDARRPQFVFTERQVGYRMPKP